MYTIALRTRVFTGSGAEPNLSLDNNALDSKLARAMWVSNSLENKLDSSDQLVQYCTLMKYSDPDTNTAKSLALSPGDHPRLAHYHYIKTVAPSLPGRLVDVDGTLEPDWIGAADVTTLEGDVLVLWDFTTSLKRSMWEHKLMKLREEASHYKGKYIAQIATFTPTLPVAPEADLMHEFKHMPYNAMTNIGRLLISSDANKVALVDKLSEKFDGTYSKLIRDTINVRKEKPETLISDSDAEKCSEFMKEQNVDCWNLIASNSLIDDSVADLFTHVCAMESYESKSDILLNGSIKAPKKISGIKFAKEVKYFGDRFLEAYCKSMEFHISTGNDYAIGVLQNGKVVIEECPKVLQFLVDKVQEHITFSNFKELVCVSRRPKKITTYFTKGKDRVVCSDKEEARNLVINGYTILKETTYEEGLNLVVNPHYYPDERFKKFLDRHSRNNKINNLRTTTDIDIQMLQSAHKSSLNYSSSRHGNDTNILDSVLDVAQHQILDNIKFCGDVDLIELSRSILRDSRAWQEAEHHYSWARNMSSLAKGVRNANHVTLNVNAPFNSITLMFINSAHNFKTTWYRVFYLTRSVPTGIHCENHGKILLDGKEAWSASSRWASVDRNKLCWYVSMPTKALARCMHLIELRKEIYSADKQFAINEINFSILPFFCGDQQFSIVTNAIRYLYSGLTSIDCDVRQVLRKLRIARIKTFTQMSIYAAMMGPFACGFIACRKLGFNHVRDPNGTLNMVMPDLLVGTNDMSIIASSFAIKSYLNKVKFNKLDAEANAVEDLWDQIEDYKRASRTDMCKFYGLHESLLDFNGSFDQLLDQIDQIDLKEEITDLFLTPGKKYRYSFLFELYVQCKASFKYGRSSSIMSLSGKSVLEFSSTKGSIGLTDGEGVKELPSKMKVVAMLELITHLTGENDTTLLQNMGTNSLIYYDYLILVIEVYRTIEVMVGQLSQKDQDGKNRPILTLTAESVVLTMAMEELLKSVSFSLDTDMITTRDKESDIVKCVQWAIDEVKSNPDEIALYCNSDKSSFAASRSCTNFIATVSAFAPDKLTFNLMIRVIQLTESRKIRYPINLCRQALLTRPRSGFVEGNLSAVSRMELSETRVGRVGKTIHRQAHGLGAFNRPPRSLYANPVVGMPGEGIFGIISSISASCLLGEFSDTLSRYNVKSRGLVTSDDSMLCLVIKKRSVNRLMSNFMDLYSRNAATFGLVENIGKFSLSTSIAEMNSFYIVSGKPVVQLLKFISSSTAVSVSGSPGEDLLSASKSTISLMQSGASAYTASVVAAINMSLVLDVTGMKHVYKKHEESNTYQRLALPRIDPFLNMMSAFGHLTALVLDKGANLEEVIEQTLWTLQTESNGAMTAIVNATNVPIQLEPKSVDGITLRRRPEKYKSKLAKQLGKPFITAAMGIEGIARPTMSHNISDIVCSVVDHMRTPLSNERSDLDEVDIYRLFTHSRNYRKFRIQEGTLLSIALFEGKSGHASTKMLEDVVIPDVRITVEDKFDLRETVEASVLSNISFGESVRAVDYTTIKPEVEKIGRFYQISNEESRSIIEEHDYHAIYKYQRKYVKLRPSNVMIVDKVEFVNRVVTTLGRNEVGQLCPGLYNLNMTGDLSVRVAYRMALIAASRLESLSAKTIKTIAITHRHSRSKPDIISDLVSLNAITDAISSTELKLDGEVLAMSNLTSYNTLSESLMTEVFENECLTNATHRDLALKGTTYPSESHIEPSNLPDTIRVSSISDIEGFMYGMASVNSSFILSRSLIVRLLDYSVSIGRQGTVRHRHKLTKVQGTNFIENKYLEYRLQSEYHLSSPFRVNYENSTLSFSGESVLINTRTGVRHKFGYEVIVTDINRAYNLSNRVFSARVTGSCVSLISGDLVIPVIRFKFPISELKTPIVVGTTLRESDSHLNFDLIDFIITMGDLETLVRQLIKLNSTLRQFDRDYLRNYMDLIQTKVETFGCRRHANRSRVLHSTLGEPHFTGAIMTTDKITDSLKKARLSAETFWLHVYWELQDYTKDTTSIRMEQVFDVEEELEEAEELTLDDFLATMDDIDFE